MSSIELKNICLDYIIKTGSDSIKNSAIEIAKCLLGKKKKNGSTQIRHSTYRALNNVSLTINKGDRVGLLGRNGAGKSTLLRVFARIYQPNTGLIKIDGCISSLFDVNLGMDEEATGYENIINLNIMRGLNSKQANSTIADIESFTELADFLHNPVRTYSSGMRMKLAFAVATAIPPEIILIDEIIGVGDAHFMHRAQQRMTNIIESSDILVLTSHSNDIIRRFCNKAIVLNAGEIQFIGDVAAGITYYEKNLR